MILKKRITALLLSAVLLFTCPVVPAAASVLGDELHAAGTEIAEGTALAKGVYWNTAYSDKLAENYIEYTPSYTVTPIVAYGGSILSSAASFSSLASRLESRGMHVIGGINGDYFVLSNYEPLGLVMSDGYIKSSAGYYDAIGFRANGTAAIGKPGMSIKVHINGESFPIATFNKTRDSKEFALFTDDFATTTRNSVSGKDFILVPSVSGGLTPNCSIEMTVESIVDANGATTIPSGRFLLSLSQNADEWRQNGIAGLEVGDTLAISVTTANPEWHDIKYALGCYQKLVTNGSLEGGLDNTKNPRTAVGIKSDGTVVLYTIDGRQTGVSAGASMTQVAQRLIELGCVEAGLLDGGGSTSLNALYIGNEAVSQINNPSDGSPRTVTNYIMLVTTAGPTGQAARLGVYPYDALMLAGASETFSVKAADSAGYATAVPSFTYSVSNGFGTVSDSGVFTAGMAGGDETLYATAGGGVEGFATIKIIDTPDTITVYNESGWSTVSSLNLVRGQSVSLYAAASYNRMSLITNDNCYTWAVSGDIGTIDATGKFTAGEIDGSGEIRVTAGGKTAAIPVTVGWNNPFGDVKASDWFYEAIRDSYDSGLITGVSDTQFSPNTGMTRAMFVTLLSRLEGIGAQSASNPFSDVQQGQWYTDAVIWASENGIVSGYEDGSFCPGAYITREQLCTLILRYTGYLGKTLPETAEAQAFADASSISGYAADGVTACQKAGLVNGKGGNKFDPQGGATRAEVAVIIQRLLSAL